MLVHFFRASVQFSQMRYGAVNLAHEPTKMCKTTHGKNAQVPSSLSSKRERTLLETKKCDIVASYSWIKNLRKFHQRLLLLAAPLRSTNCRFLSLHYLGF